MAGQEECKESGLIVQIGKAAKERNIALRSEEMRVEKKITTQQQGPLIQFSLLLFSII